MIELLSSSQVKAVLNDHGPDPSIEGHFGLSRVYFQNLFVTIVFYQHKFWNFYVSVFSLIDAVPRESNKFEQYFSTRVIATLHKFPSILVETGREKLLFVLARNCKKLIHILA